MAKKENKIVAWIKGFINGADAKLANLVKTDLEPMMLSVIGFSLIGSIIIAVILIVLQALKLDGVITSAVSIIGAVALFGYIIKMLLPNIKLIGSIGMKIVYVVFNFVAVFIAGALAGYALSAVIMLVIVYFVLMLVLGGFGNDKESDNEENMFGQGKVGTLDNGVEITYQRGPMGEKMYQGSDGKDYESDGAGGFRPKM